MAYLDEIREVEAFTALPRARRNLVFYSEGPEYWLHFRGIIRELIDRRRYPLVYLSSQPDDPGLHIRSPLLTSFLIGSGSVRTNLFSGLDADVMVVTMPDLENLNLKRSPHCRHYAYIFHSPVSTHMIYQPAAFDHYDSIFCVGSHHEREIRAREALIGARPKTLIRHGYGRLDEIIATAPPPPPVGHGSLHVLIAPSWGPHGIFETFGRSLVEILLSAGYYVTARPHPQTIRLASEKIEELRTAFAADDHFRLETDLAQHHSLERSNVMITDWSGAALDFAFGLLKPVIFLDTPRKMNNPAYQELGIEPLEVTIRGVLGRIVDPGDLDALPAIVSDLARSGGAGIEEIRFAREQSIHNVGTSAAVAAAELVRIAIGFATASAATDATIEVAAEKTALAFLEPFADATRAGAPGAVIPFLAGLIGKRDVLSASPRAKLDALCRRIDVFKRLAALYDERFVDEVDPAALPPEVCFTLAYVLIRAAERLEDGERGQALKFLNSAGNALNIYTAAGGVVGAPLLESLFFQTFDALEGRP